MNKKDIEKAIDGAQNGIRKYLAIMDSITVDISKDKAFQTKYNGFYRVRQRTPEWYENYFTLMQELKGNPHTFNDVLDELKNRTGRYEPSFSSKLVATINPNKPIWDIYILKNTSHKPPSYSNNKKFDLAKESYQSIERWYESFIPSENGKLCIDVFNKKVKEHGKITDLKKIDFILWQTRKNDHK